MNKPIIRPQPLERYYSDPMFRALVDSLIHQIREANYTPSEIREAAMLAQIMYEETILKPIILERIGRDET